MEASPEKPIYKKVLHDDCGKTKLYFIVCDEGWRELIVCERMYRDDANWLLKILEGRPFTKGRRKKN